MRWTLWLALASWTLLGEAKPCPAHCSGHGYCSKDTNFDCLCERGFTGIMCDLRVCPAGRAWAAQPTRTDLTDGEGFENDVTHPDYQECSNRGVCDRSSGVCFCEKGFTGSACDRMYCPSTLTPLAEITLSGTSRPCSGVGRCLTLREASNYKDFENHFSISPEYAKWDADRVTGCYCDAGWSGVSCSNRTCLTGVNPADWDVDQSIPYFTFSCTSQAGCTGDQANIVISVDGSETIPIPFNAGPQLVRYRLRQVRGVGDVSVIFTNSAEDVCSSATTDIKINFRNPLRSYTVSVSSQCATAITNVDGGHLSGPTVEPCSGRGTCSAGVCKCDTHFRSSDGYGSPGDRGDCGALDVQTGDPYPSIDRLMTPIPPDERCPFIMENNVVVPCSGHGTCDPALNYRCNCDSGYSGRDCSKRTIQDCPLGLSWVGQTGDELIMLPCSGVGVCVDGECKSCEPYGGEACEILVCPTNFLDPESPQCSGHGTCEKRLEGNREIEYCVCDAKVFPISHPGTAYYYGGDCSLVPCPMGTVDSDVPATECSGKGSCDQNSGICSCAPGFTGLACELINEILWESPIDPYELQDQDLNENEGFALPTGQDEDLLW